MSPTDDDANKQKSASKATELVTRCDFACLRLDMKDFMHGRDSTDNLNELVQSMYLGYKHASQFQNTLIVNVGLIKDTSTWGVLKMKNISWDASIYNVLEFFEGQKVSCVVDVQT